MMGKKIWIVNPQTGSPEKAANPRYLELAKYFMQAGYDVITFNSSQREGISVPNGKFLEKRYGDYKFVHVYAPPYSGNGIRRMLSLHQFARNVSRYHKCFGKPDVILQNIHPPFDYPIVRLAKKLKVKYIAEAWDLWPADFVHFGLIGKRNPAMIWAYAVEKKYYYHADEIVFTFLGGLEYLKNKGWTVETGGKVDMNHVHYINNGVDLAQFDQNKIKYSRDDEDMRTEDCYKIVYLGSIQKSNHLQTLIDAAAILKDNPKYRFFVYGNGAHRCFLEQYVKDHRIDNVIFKEKRIPLAECAWVVSQATVNILNYDKGFGWMGLSSGKLFQYLAAGKPIVCNINIDYDDLITDNNLGVARNLDTAEAFALEIQRIAEQPKEDYDAMCSRVRKVAEQFDYSIMAAKEIELL